MNGDMSIVIIKRTEQQPRHEIHLSRGNPPKKKKKNARISTLIVKQTKISNTASVRYNKNLRMHTTKII